MGATALGRLLFTAVETSPRLLDHSDTYVNTCAIEVAVSKTAVLKAPAPRTKSTIKIPMPYGSKRPICRAVSVGAKPKMTLNPASGGMGIRLNTAKVKLMRMVVPFLFGWTRELTLPSAVILANQNRTASSRRQGGRGGVVQLAVMP